MRWSVNTYNKGRGILILAKGITQGLNYTLVAEIQYSINFTRPVIQFCWWLHYNGNNSFLFVNSTKIYQFKAEDDSEMEKISLVFRNISGEFSANNMKQAGLNGYMFDFSVAYRAFNTSNIIDIHKCLMKNHGIK